MSPRNSPFSLVPTGFKWFTGDNNRGNFAAGLGIFKLASEERGHLQELTSTGQNHQLED
jgi:hypothetical protein